MAWADRVKRLCSGVDLRTLHVALTANGHRARVGAVPVADDDRAVDDAGTCLCHPSVAGACVDDGVNV